MVQRLQRLNQDSLQHAKLQARRIMQWNSVAFNYDPSYDYASEPSIQIVFMDKSGVGNILDCFFPMATSTRFVEELSCEYRP